ncbi:MAG: hypothetical protein ACJATV_001155 [Granulosicoccus sp.]|jgi:hypothetical protein
MVSMLVLVGCSAGPFVGAFEEPEDPSVPKGPGVFSGEKGTFNVSEAFDEDKKKLKSGGYYILDLDGSPRMSEEEFKEFESFRAWLSSREQGTEEYKEYEAWKAYQQYRDSK